MIYYIQKIEIDGQQPAHDCLKSLIKTFVKMIMFKEIPGNPLQYEAAKSWIDLPDIIPAAEHVIDIIEKGPNLPLNTADSPLWTSFGK